MILDPRLTAERNANTITTLEIVGHLLTQCMACPNGMWHAYAICHAQQGCSTASCYHTDPKVNTPVPAHQILEMLATAPSAGACHALRLRQRAQPPPMQQR